MSQYVKKELKIIYFDVLFDLDVGIQFITSLSICY